MSLRNDCFTLPPGVHWTPFTEALQALRDRMAPVADHEKIPLAQADGRILAQDILAPRACPPYANAAVDGYAFAHKSLSGAGEERLRLLEGRAAAGHPFTGDIPTGAALRILTGAPMPAGADTVLLQEDVTLEEGRIGFPSGLKPGANARKAGEDVQAGALALTAGRRLTPADIAQAAAMGLQALPLYKPLRVGVLSTGDELAQGAAGPFEIYDSNRPLLCALLRRLGMEAVDIGWRPDDREAIETALIEGAHECDALITSGGASGGDEDHIARALREMGALHHWRIAIKPGRPLALAQIGRKPVFGLPGNPVAVFVCFLVFLRPALLRMQGADWPEPARFALQAAFDYRKKPGRAEFLRGRLGAQGQAEKFRSEGSGLISGLRWSDGLIMLEHERGPVQRGDMVDFIPYSALGAA